MQEAFLTAYRVRVAEARGREFLERVLAAKRSGKELPKLAETGGH
jgi:hypothetical protein